MNEISRIWEVASYEEGVLTKVRHSSRRTRSEVVAQISRQCPGVAPSVELTTRGRATQLTVTTFQKGTLSIVIRAA